MTENTLTILNSPPPLEEFIEFRANCGWGRLDLQTARKTINAGIANVTAYDDNKLVGFGRTVGDGAIYFYIQDLIVIEEYRGQNIGTSIVESVIEQISEIASPGASIGLMSAMGKEMFYERLGFSRRPNHNFGAGMTLVLELASTSRSNQ